METWQIIGIVLSAIGVIFGILNFTKKKSVPQANSNNNPTATNSSMSVGGSIGNNNQITIQSPPPVNSGNVNQTHLGSGDNIGGNKIINNNNPETLGKS